MGQMYPFYPFSAAWCSDGGDVLIPVRRGNRHGNKKGRGFAPRPLALVIFVAGDETMLTLDISNARHDYIDMSIQSFRCRDTCALWDGERVRKFAQIEKAAMRKLAMLNAASRLEDLRIPTGESSGSPERRPLRPVQHPRE